MWPSPSSRLVASGPARLIVADDDRELRSLLVAAFRRDGWSVREASGGSDLLLALSGWLLDGGSQPADLLISDVRMPGVSGLGVAQGLASCDRRLPTILITAFADDTLRLEAARSGVLAVFDKPFDIDDLRTVAANFHALMRHQPT
jgi:DNA-binding NtrC family response regulator